MVSFFNSPRKICYQNKKQNFKSDQWQINYERKKKCLKWQKFFKVTQIKYLFVKFGVKS